jgi:hypothetical protein
MKASGKMMEKSVWRTSGHGSSPFEEMRARTEIEQVFLAGKNEA